MSKLSPIEKGEERSIVAWCRPPDPHVLAGVSSTKTKEKIPVDNGTYIEQIENITSKGEPND
ncbi:hypothetical protein [Rhizobium sp. N122]|uniref:hypothetical protein n=1 Tax=Rhizobium sp. N122 TaxID=1764272 RepID=UPI0011798D94|nr:hypothetical protein [Rhizobium sp. N122]